MQAFAGVMEAEVLALLALPKGVRRFAAERYER
jgi:hypothetical protein